jgi:hypothetical protein
VKPVELPFKTDGADESGLQLVMVEASHLVECMTGAAHWQKFDDRRTKNDKWVATGCPRSVAEMLLTRKQWRFPVLTGIINAPTLRPDGSLLDKPGYDEKTGLLFKPGETKFPSILKSPSMEDAAAAMELLQGLISTFPFKTEVDKAVALSGILTAVVRRSLRAAPVHAVSAPVAGSGKGMIVNIAAIISTGKRAPVIAQGRTEEETEKRLGAKLIEGAGVICIDNCTLPLDGDFLCQVVTEESVNVRLLGKSINVEVPANASLFATGQNLVVKGDMTRRVLMCAIDARTERPELRVFQNDPLKTALDNRGDLVVAALTIMRACHLANPDRKPPLGSFEKWSRWVRDALTWLKLPDPCESIERIRTKDPERANLRAVISQWHTAIGTAAISVQQLIEKANSDDGLREVLVAVAGDKDGINSRRLGKYFAKIEDRDVTTFQGIRARLTRDRETAAGIIWKVEEMRDEPKEEAKDEDDGIPM